MRRIYKYSVPIQDHIEIMMPEECVILSCQMQHGEPWLWAVVDDQSPMIPHHFHMVGTGHPADHLDGSFIDTFQMQEGRLVFHLFNA